MLSMRFPQKLWKIVNECRTGAIKWSLGGGTILLDYKKFQEEYLSARSPIFKTNNITSFIRQLNLYGFRKVTSHNRDPVCNANNPDIHEFLHEHFRSGRSDLLAKVCRKAGSNKPRPAHRSGGGANRMSVDKESKQNEACDSPDGDFQRMTPLQVCQVSDRQICVLVHDPEDVCVTLNFIFASHL